MSNTIIIFVQPNKRVLKNVLKTQTKTFWNSNFYIELANTTDKQKKTVQEKENTTIESSSVNSVSIECWVNQNRSKKLNWIEFHIMRKRDLAILMLSAFAIFFSLQVRTL